MDAQSLLYNAAQMPVTELESFIHQLNALVTRKKTPDNNVRETVLLDKINRTVLAKLKRERYHALIYKLEMETISDTDHAELLELVEEEEKIRVKRLKYLIELSQLRNTTLPQLMKTLELTEPIPSNV
jgi:hypothetical protein